MTCLIAPSSGASCKSMSNPFSCSSVPPPPAFPDSNDTESRSMLVIEARADNCALDPGPPVPVLLKIISSFILYPCPTFSIVTPVIEPESISVISPLASLPVGETILIKSPIS